MIRKSALLVAVALLTQTVAGCNAKNIRALSSVVGTISDASDTISEEGVEVANTACPAIASGDLSGIKVEGDAKAQAEVKAFLSAVHNMLEYTKNLNRGARAHCKALGVALGLQRKALEKQEHGPYGGAEEICSAAAQQFERTGLRATIAYQAPTCNVPLDDARECLAACGSGLKGLELAASCKGGKVTGTCTGTCKGSCDVEMHGTCAGACDANCSGACDTGFHGSCSGVCKGTCDGAEAQGTCAGVCDGACDAGGAGSCQGVCQGDCSGNCSAQAGGACGGRCSGDCEGTFQAVRCEGKFDPPRVDTACHASCVLQASTNMQCSDPKVDVKLVGRGDLKKLEHALSTELPRLVQIAVEAGPRGVEQLEALASAGAKLKADLGSAGAHTLTCLASGVTLATASASSLGHTVKASVSVRGMAGANLAL